MPAFGFPYQKMPPAGNRGYRCVHPEERQSPQTDTPFPAIFWVAASSWHGFPFLSGGMTSDTVLRQPVDSPGKTQLCFGKMNIMLSVIIQWVGLGLALPNQFHHQALQW